MKRYNKSEDFELISGVEEIKVSGVKTFSKSNFNETFSNDIDVNYHKFKLQFYWFSFDNKDMDTYQYRELECTFKDKTLNFIIDDIVYILNDDGTTIEKIMVY